VDIKDEKKVPDETKAKVIISRRFRRRHSHRQVIEGLSCDQNCKKCQHHICGD